MNSAKKLLLFIYIIFLSAKINAQVITIDDSRNADDLIKNTLINSTCFSVSNSSSTGDNYRPGRQSFAYFNRNGSNFPFNEGVVLVTSTAQSAIGPFVSNPVSNDNVNWIGDNDLNQTLNISSTNATVLEFDFIAVSNSLSFNYIFASNEYQYDYPCLYSDGFAFLIKKADDPTDPYRNLAIIPETTIPVSSKDIHPAIPAGIGLNGSAYDGCAAQNQTYFGASNSENTGSTNFAAQTVVMTAQSNVIAGEKYHIKLVIADDQNRNLESAIFLEAGSFTSKIALGEDRTIAANNPACFGEQILLDSKLDNTYTYKWYKKDNPAVTLSTNSTYLVNDAGTYVIEATLIGTSCLSKGEIKIDYAPEILSTNASLLQCDDNTDGISIFNLTKVDNIVKNNVATIQNKGYYESLADAEARTNAILTPENYINKSRDQIVFARLENQFNCFKIAQVTLKISNEVIPDQEPVKTCDNDNIQDGLYEFNLNTEVTPQITLGLPSGLTVNYFLTANDAITETNLLPNLFKNTIPFSQTIYARVVNGPDCYDITPVTLVVNTFDPPNFEEETKYVCKDDEIDLAVATTFSSYLWNVPSDNDTYKITVSQPGDYAVKVTDANGCEKTKTFKVLLSEPAVITGAEIKDFSANENSVLLQYTGVGNYEFSLDGTFFQDEPNFTNVSPGVYKAIAKDKNGCGDSNLYTIYVLDYPRFFTPNGDGFNDLWYIKNLDQFPDYTISIFDRYGKLLKQMNQNSPGWSGQFNGRPLSSDDYWFNLIFVDGKNVKGHFSLKR